MIFVRVQNCTKVYKKMKDKTISILTALQNLKKPNPDEENINIIVEASYQIALTYISEIYKNINVNILQDDLKIEDLAIDSIKPLMNMNEDGYLFSFINTFNQQKLFPKTEEDSIYLLNKIISQQVEDRISFMLKENDKSFSKIMNWIELLAKSEGYKKINYFGNNYLVEKDVTQISGIVLNEKDFKHLPADLFKQKDEILKTTFSYLKRENKFFPAIPLNILGQHLKNTYMKEHILKKDIKNYADASDVNAEPKIKVLLKKKKSEKSNILRSK